MATFTTTAAHHHLPLNTRHRHHHNHRHHVLHTTPPLEPVHIGRQRYHVREKLADTLYGGVYLCEDARHDGAVVAIKHVVLSKATHALEALAASVDNPWVERSTLVHLARLEPHAHILRVRDEFVEDGAWHVVMDHCNGGDLLSALQRTPAHRFSEPQAIALFADVVEAVRFLHANSIAHRDLSLENVLLHDGVPKLCDFGLSTDARRACCDRVGKAYYMAPEVVAEQPYDPVAADVWSLGVVLFIMLTGSPLVPSASESDTAFVAVKKFGVRAVLQVWGMEFSTAAIDLLEALLEVDPAARCTVEDVAAHVAAAFPPLGGL